MSQISDYMKWKAEHPAACTHCNGLGQVFVDEQQIGLVGYEPCAWCVSDGICPVCGHQHGENWCTDKYEACEACGAVPGKTGAIQYTE